MKMKKNSRANFERSLRRAALVGFFTGKISGKEWLQVRSVLQDSVRKTPEGEEVDLIEEIAEGCVIQLQEDGNVPVGATVDSIDWTAVINFITNGLPQIMALITQLLALFGK